jgi:NAD(P)-dependent dehydrogenase (short-subunit alcohol dehydrogenase family)
MDFDNETVVVTGSAQGIGRATAQHFHDRGADVVIADIDETAAEQAASELFDDGSTLGVGVDVSNRNEVQALVDVVAEEFGGVDILVNNAGVSQTVEPTVDQSIDEWERVVDIHLKGTFVCSKLFAPQLLDNGGRIVNVSSTTAFGAFPYRTAYGPAKAAIRNLTKVLAVEWATDDIRVNAVAPSYVRTDLVEDLIVKGKVDEKKIHDRTPMARLAEPSFVADAIGFLASDRAQFITGVVLPVDGGWTAYGHF